MCSSVFYVVVKGSQVQVEIPVSCFLNYGKPIVSTLILRNFNGRKRTQFFNTENNFNYSVVELTRQTT
jgi:hypothetical protein